MKTFQQDGSTILFVIAGWKSEQDSCVRQDIFKFYNLHYGENKDARKIYIKLMLEMALSFQHYQLCLCVVYTSLLQVYYRPTDTFGNCLLMPGLAQN